MRSTRSLAVLAVVLLAACGGDDPAERSEGASAARPPAAGAAEVPGGDVADALLTLDDMPTGWVPAPEVMSDQGGTGECDLPAWGADDDAGAEAAFKAGGGVPPFVLHVVADLGHETAAADFVDDFAAVARRCQSAEENGVTTTIQPLLFPSLGDESLAYRMDRDDPEGDHITLNLLAVRSGERAAYIAISALEEPPDAALTEELATLAAERLRAG